MIAGPPRLSPSKSLLKRRDSIPFAILDEAQTSRLYHRALASKAATMRKHAIDSVSLQLLHDLIPRVVC